MLASAKKYIFHKLNWLNNKPMQGKVSLRNQFGLNIIIILFAKTVDTIKHVLTILKLEGTEWKLKKPFLFL